MAANSPPAMGLRDYVVTKSRTTLRDLVGMPSLLNGSCGAGLDARAQTLSWFVLTVLGFSFWFFLAVPFASHRETYWWLAMVHNHGLGEAFSGISKTYRPLAQSATWLGVMILDPHIFPTSIIRQTLLQGFMYGMFVLAWWLIYPTAVQRRLFALVACVAGGVFFSGYVQLFHIYGIFYVAVMLTLGALLRFRMSRALQKRELWFAAVATVLSLWHPFATALFVGFYFGFYLETFRLRTRAQHIAAFTILFIGMLAIVILVVAVPTQADTMSLAARLSGFQVSYQTNEVNLAASLVAFILTQMVVFSLRLTRKVKLSACVFVCVLSVVCVLNSLPVLFLWVCVALIKLFRLRSWGLFCLTVAAGLLPFGGGIGTPMYALFVIILAAYVTALGWLEAERALSFVRARYVVGAAIVAAVVVLALRMGSSVPIVTRAARPLLSERERTYQLEQVMAWLHNSEYCGCEIAFAENAGNPVDSVDSAIERRNRPPAALEDVRLFWKGVLQCRRGARSNNGDANVVVTFGAARLANSRRVFEVGGRYAGDAAVWIRDSGK